MADEKAIAPERLKGAMGTKDVESEDVEEKSEDDLHDEAIRKAREDYLRMWPLEAEEKR